MSDFNIVAEKRDDLGKGASRRLRRAGKVPGIIYGAGQDPASFQVKHTELEKSLASEAFYSSILTLLLDGKEESVVLKDLQRHPFRNRIMHLDLLRIDKTHKLTMNIPLHFINEEKCVGVKQEGGVVSHHINDIEVSCLAADLPEYIEVDMLDVNLDETVHLSDLKMPEGVEINALLHEGDASQPVASVHAPRISATDEELDQADAAAAEEDADAEDSDEDSGDSDD